MFVYESKNYKTSETDSITGKNVIELCASILNYNNNLNTDDDKYINVVICNIKP